ncbi:MAG: hypothetical protein IPH37_07995 [Burkholderiales bacterium]|nr:hypothetical protein [Burkholderiales bacterium]
MSQIFNNPTANQTLSLGVRDVAHIVAHGHAPGAGTHGRLHPGRLPALG